MEQLRRANQQQLGDVGGDTNLMPLPLKTMCGLGPFDTARVAAAGEAISMSLIIKAEYFHQNEHENADNGQGQKSSIDTEAKNPWIRGR